MKHISKHISLITILSVLSFSTAAVAGGGHYSGASSSAYSASNFTSFYVGGYASYDWSEMKITPGQDAHTRGWEGGIFTGYRLDSLMAHTDGFGIGMNGAVEAFYGWSNSDDETVGTNSVDKESEWGVSFRPGFSFIDEATKDMGLSSYGILGYRRTEFESTGAGFTGSKYFNGFELGVGSELLTYSNFGIRAEYSHTWYSSDANVDVDSHNVRMGVAYHF